jgi:hypothetical protein
MNLEIVSGKGMHGDGDGGVDPHEYKHGACGSGRVK